MTLRNFFKKLFRVNKQIDKNLEIAAYHESGHIVLAYFSNYTCDSLELDVYDPGAGIIRMDYGQDLMLITSLTNCKTDGSLFNSLDKTEKAKSPEIADIVATILLAGSAAEATFLNGGKVNGNMKVEISGPDLVRVNNIDYFHSLIDQEHNPNYMNDKLHETLALMNTAEIWKAVDELAKKILSQDNYKIDKFQIEDTLKECGFFDYIKSLR